MASHENWYRYSLGAGNLLFLLGFPFLIGFSRAIDLFNPIKRPAKRVPIAFFFVGIMLVFVRWTFVGFIFEILGMISMFGAFLPIVVVFLRAAPVVGPFFSLPVIGTIVDKLAGSTEKRAPV